jgi:hypothetical protein
MSECFFIKTENIRLEITAEGKRRSNLYRTGGVDHSAGALSLLLVRQLPEEGEEST